MAHYSLAQSAKASKKAKKTILDALKSGKLSGVKDPETGNWSIDPSELNRVFTIKNEIDPETGKPVLKNNTERPIKTPETMVIDELIKAKDELIEQLKSERDKVYGLLENNSSETNKQIESLRKLSEAQEMVADSAQRQQKVWRQKASRLQKELEAEQSKSIWLKIFG